MDEYFKDPAPHLPKHVVLEMARELSDLVTNLSQMDHLGIDTQVAIADVLDEVNKDTDAEHNLSISHHEIEASTADTELADDTAKYLAVRKAFAKDLLQQLRDLRMYVRGMLYYELKSVQYGMLVLQKLQVPILELEKHDRRLARQADLACRRYYPRTEFEAPSKSLVEQFGPLQPGRSGGATAVGSVRRPKR